MEYMTVLLGFGMGAIVGGALGFIAVFTWAKGKLLKAHTIALEKAKEVAADRVAVVSKRILKASK